MSPLHKPFRVHCLHTSVLLLTLMTISCAQDRLTGRQHLDEAENSLAAKEYDKAVEHAKQAADKEKRSTRIQQRAGEIIFLAGKPTESLPYFDKANELEPQLAADNWQRGIALACASKWKEGAAQFKLHHDVNPNDVENSAWYFLCLAKSENPTKAEETIIPSGGDPRPPMMAVLEMLKGKKTPEEVITSAEQMTVAGSQRELALFYADLYVGLYYDSIGKSTEAKKFLQSSLTRKTGGYMLDTARIYLDHQLKNAETAK